MAFIWFVVGVWVGIAVMCLMHMARDPMDLELEEKKTLRGMTEADFEEAHK